ncbi:hypothetical protein TPA0908_10130 [Micromonospora sp. AKA38]|nr:hypothetical protein TPA0908_10130 [Micromonospora sp. AKA38]
MVPFQNAAITTTAAAAAYTQNSVVRNACFVSVPGAGISSRWPSCIDGIGRVGDSIMLDRFWTSDIGRFIGLVDAACVLIWSSSGFDESYGTPRPAAAVRPRHGSHTVAGAPSDYPPPETS